MKIKKATQCVHAGAGSTPRIQGVTTPIVTSTSFLFPNDDDEVVYPRYFNVANQEIVASKIASLENGERGLVLSSGMAAISSVLLGILKSGDHAVFQSGIYGGTRSFMANRLSRYGIEHSLVEGCDIASFEQSLRENTKLIFFESPTNPLLQIVDIAAIADLAKARGILTVVDNTFATPINQNPLDLGIEIVIHSGTKYLNGHSDVNCGAIVTSSELMSPILGCAVNLGGTLDVRACYLLERGTKTLDLRVKQQCENAMRLARFLAEHPRVRKVYFPGLRDHPGHELAARQMKSFGAMLSFELDTDEGTANAMLQNLSIGTLAVSLGGVETLICFPKETSHAKMTEKERQREGISATLARVSVGIEDADDLVNDFDDALK